MAPRSATRRVPGGRGGRHRRAGGRFRPVARPDGTRIGYAVVVAASVTPAAFAALRTAPATAPATLSLKTLGMM